MSARVRILAVHADYRCRHSGACCSSDWEIPLEDLVERRLQAALREGRLRLPVRETVRLEGCFTATVGEPTAGAERALGRDARGVCVFRREAPGRCVVHEQLGESALPVACRQFPRVATLTPLGVSLTLSHYCPTAAELLFRSDPGADGGDSLLRIVENPPAFPGTGAYEGLDAQAGLPLVRPGVFMSWAAFESWEAHAVSTLARGLQPEAALAALAVDAERLRRWTPADGEFDRHLERQLAKGSANEARADNPAPGIPPTPFEAWEEVAAAVPGRHRRPVPPPVADRDAIEGLIDTGWPAAATPIRRWLAARAFASWFALQGEGVRTHVRGLQVALALLRAEAFRACGQARRPLDAEMLQQAFRRADLLFVQLADPERLAARFSFCERGPC